MRWTLLVLPVLALLSGVACSEQQPSPAAQELSFPGTQDPPLQEPSSQTMEGILTRVDPDIMRISIRTPDGSARSFSYSDSTLVTGSEDTIEGLGKSGGARIRISYTIGGQGNEAEKVEVLTGQAGAPPAGGTYQ